MTNTYQSQDGTTHPRLIVTAASDREKSAAIQLAGELGVNFTPDIRDAKVKDYHYALVYTADYLGLQDIREHKFAPFYIDFLSGKMRYRSDQAGLKRELLAKALSLKPKDQPRIIDATAGLGRDSFILAKLGFTVILLERSPVIYVLLRDALRRAAMDETTAAVVARMELIHADAGIWLPGLTEEQRPDIVYLDPMFPEREKSASVKKEMVILQNLLEKDVDTVDLLSIAIACSKRRVVVKRPRLAPGLSVIKPSYTLTGKSSRFDIYLV
jgi:16S rRNA (guanine1516-N2)-methyltransferase